MVTPGKSIFQIGKSVVSNPVVVGLFMYLSKPERGGSFYKQTKNLKSNMNDMREVCILDNNLNVDFQAE